jgi:NAD(P)-dependent dehydrogenase (short-subunit alcohol dehydrogenase family)
MGKREGHVALITGGNSGIGLATDLKDRRIRVNAVSPGPIDTPGLNDLVASTGAGEQRLKMLSALFRLAGSVHPKRSPRPSCFSHPTTVATSRQRNCSWMAAWHRCSRYVTQIQNRYDHYVRPLPMRQNPRRGASRGVSPARAVRAGAPRARRRRRSGSSPTAGAPRDRRRCPE